MYRTLQKSALFAELLWLAFNNNNNNNNIYLLQLGCYPVAVIILHLKYSADSNPKICRWRHVT